MLKPQPRDRLGCQNPEPVDFGRNDNTSFTTVYGPGSGIPLIRTPTRIRLTITFNAASYRYWRVSITSNTGSSGGQLAEYELWAN